MRPLISLQQSWNQPWVVEPELARAKRRAELEAKIEREAGKLASTGPAQVANADAKVLARYAAAIGFDVTVDRLNDLLVLLAVLMIEAGGGLSLVLGMALGAAPASRREARMDTPVSQPDRPQKQPMDVLVDAATIASVQASIASGHQRPPRVHTGDLASVQPSIASRHQCPSGVHAGDLTAWLRARGGAAQTSMRRLALELGRSPAGVHVEVGRLAAAGVLTAVAGSRGTDLTLAAAARPN